MGVAITFLTNDDDEVMCVNLLPSVLGFILTLPATLSPSYLDQVRSQAR